MSGLESGASYTVLNGDDDPEAGHAMTTRVSRARSVESVGNGDLFDRIAMGTSKLRNTPSEHSSAGAAPGGYYRPGTYDLMDKTVVSIQGQGYGGYTGRGGDSERVVGRGGGAGGDHAWTRGKARPYTATQKSLAVMGGLNFVYFFVQLVVAAQSRSLSMLSDAFHNLSDVAAGE